jgi:hypothetical protein
MLSIPYGPVIGIIVLFSGAGMARDRSSWWWVALSMFLLTAAMRRRTQGAQPAVTR